MMDLKDTSNADPPPGRCKERNVSELLSGLVDGIRNGNSQEPVLVAPSPGQTWTVTSLNKYGGDLIMNLTGWVRDYQQEIAAGRARARAARKPTRRR